MTRIPGLLLLVLVVVGLLAPAAGAQPAAGAVPPGLGIRLLDAPVDRADDPRARVYVVDHLAPGQTIERRIAVTNGTGRPATIRLYPAAAGVDERGFHLAGDESGGELVDWVGVEPATLTLPEGGTGTATVTVAVAPDATAGEHYGAVLAELPGDPTGGVGVTARVGIRLYLSVGAGGEPATDFVVEALTARRDAAGRPVVEARVRNTGGRAIDLTGELTLSEGPGGTRAGPFPAELGTTIAPGARAPMTVVLDRDLPAGPWSARMVARSGSVERAAEATIFFPGAAGSRAGPVGATPVPADHDGSLPAWADAALVILLISVIVLLWRRRRRRERDDPSGAGGEGRPADGSRVAV